MKEGDAVFLDVPPLKQERNNTCVPCCMLMVIGYLNKLVLTEPTGPLDEDRIAKAVLTFQQGTHFPNTKLVNDEVEIIRASPSVEFVPEFEFHELRDIGKELDKKLPVIIWVHFVKGEDDYRHAVVVTGWDRPKKEFYYNEPTYGSKETISEREFITAWEPMGTKMLKVKIGRVKRPTLAEFVKESEKVV